MARAIATTPDARDYHRLEGATDGGPISPAGTAEALITGIDKYLAHVLAQLAWGGRDLLRSSLRSIHGPRGPISLETYNSPRAAAIIAMKYFSKIFVGIH
jgi:hypothetical protein